MPTQFEQLVTSPYDDGPRGKRSLLGWLIGLGAVAIVVGIAVVVLGGDNAMEDAFIAEVSDTATSAPGATEEEGGGAGNSTEVVASEDEPLPELTFDTSAFGSEEALEPIGEGTITDNWGVMVAVRLNVDEEFHVGSIPEERLDLVGATGVNTNPYQDSFGGPTMCFGLVGVQGASLDCFPTD